MLAGCAGSSAQVGSSPGGDDAGSSADAEDHDASGPAPGGDGSAPPSADDGAPAHTACAPITGTAINGSYGRLDGFLRSVIPPGHACGGDANHVHLRVEANGQVYDFAVNIFSDQQPATPDVYYLEKDAALASGPWVEGWHSSGVSLDYPTNLKATANDFTQTPSAPLASKVAAALQSANHISVYASPYTGTDSGRGADKVHRNGGGHDGAVVVNPTASTSHFLMFHFSGQAF